MVREKEDGRGEKTKRSSLTNDSLSTESLFLPTNFNATGRQKDETYSFFSDDLATTFLSPSLTSSNPSIVLDQDTNENGNDNPVNRRSGSVIQETTTTTTTSSTPSLFNFTNLGFLDESNHDENNGSHHHDFSIPQPPPPQQQQTQFSSENMYTSPSLLGVC